MLENVIRPKFPPTLTTDILLEKLRKSKKPYSKINAYFVYRMEFQEEYHRNNIKIPTTKISSITSISWKEESVETKAFYKKLADDAKSLYKPKDLYFVEDKHMKKIKSNQENGKVLPSRVTGVADSDYVDQTVQTSDPFEETSGLLIDGSSASIKFYEHPGTNSADIELFGMLDS
ncbi:16318_t:CDS:1 [Funneliformis mosseae]|uniref:16318_t:CDS:1 n=1 Tax=Funneliformis mosseae TaxID=27381 RepID=A0A9N9AW60_FUNMO|nr:16318_t:CDS:1 [Funneliformis mosseae]